MSACHITRPTSTSPAGALLAAVAKSDFQALKCAFDEQDREQADAGRAIRGAARTLIAYAIGHSARYRLLFSDPRLQLTPELRATAFGPFSTFARIVERAQQTGTLPPGDTVKLTGLIYAALHGAIDLQIGGRAGDAKGLSSVETTAALLFDLLGSAA